MLHDPRFNSSLMDLTGNHHFKVFPRPGQMLIFPGGCERTDKQFRDLFAVSGWRLNRIIPTAAADSIIEGVPA